MCVLFFICTFIIYKAEEKVVFDNNIAKGKYFSEFVRNNLILYEVNESYDYNITIENSLFADNFTFWDICHATFVEPYGFVTVLSLENDFLYPEIVYSELGLVQWHIEVETFTSSSAVIIVVKSVGQLHKLLYTNVLIWNQNSIFVIVILECADDAKLEMAALWQLFRIYKYVLICGWLGSEIYTFSPFLPTDGSRIVQVKELNEIKNTIIHGVDNMHGSEMCIVFFPRIPTAVARRGKYVGGVDYTALMTLRDKMNFSPTIFRPSDGHTFTQAGKNATGSIRDIVIGNADIAFNGHFFQNYKLNEIILTNYMYMDKICFIVGMPTFKSHYAVILHIFSPAVWSLIVIMYFTLVILYYQIQQIMKNHNQNYQLEELFLLFYELIIFGATSIRTDLISKKFLLGGVLVTVLILNNTFQGSLVTVLSKPIRNPFIDTLEQLIGSDLGLKSQRAESLLSDPEIIKVLNVFRQRKVNKKNFIRLGRFPIMKLLAYRNYFYFKRNSTEHLHTVPECIMSNFLGYVVPKNSPFLQRINSYLLQFQEVGLNAKWFGVEMDDLLRSTYWPLEYENVEVTQAKIFTMEDVAFVFTILLSGLALSTVVFFIEQITAFKPNIYKR